MTYHREYKKLYDTSRWKRLRLQKLAEQPLCQKCQKKGITLEANVVHHMKPHKGDLNLFYCSIAQLESLCAQCHNIITGQIEPYGFTTDIGLDGWPIDSNHPVYNSQKF